MTRKKTTKYALLSSVMAMVLSVAMLMGTTFAWFTDTASTAVNKIQAGKLDIALEMKNAGGNWVNAEGETLGWVAADGRGQDEILWEPGCTYELQPVVIKNNGNLALKYKIVITGIQGDAELNEAIEWTINDANLGADHSLAAGASHTLTISGHMKETAGNEYQGLSIDGIAITVYATQDTVENDSYGNQYDADATYPTYPLGLTKDSFTPEQKAVDSNGNFYNSFADAMTNVADNGTLYFKEDIIINFPTHLNVTKNVTIYANGTDFSGKDISIGTYAVPENIETTINIYDAKNLVVWGGPTTGLPDYCTWNVNFYNCTNDGYNFLMYRGDESATAKINLTLTNCSANGFHDSTVHTTADGSINIKDCTFTNNCAPVNISHKQSGAMIVTVENSKFVNCGKVDIANDYFAPVRFVNTSATGTLDVTLINNTFTGTIGTNGDILLGDYRDGKPSLAVTATIDTSNPVMVKSSAASAYIYNGGTITINE